MPKFLYQIRGYRGDRLHEILSRMTRSERERFLVAVVKYVRRRGLVSVKRGH